MVTVMKLMKIMLHDKSIIYQNSDAQGQRHAVDQKISLDIPNQQILPISIGPRKCS